MAWKTRDIIVAAAIAVPLGLVWSLVWGQLWTFGRAILPELGFFVAGFYIAAGVLVGYIVRTPGRGAAGRDDRRAHRGPADAVRRRRALVLGLVQGLGIEVVFAAHRAIATGACRS